VSRSPHSHILQESSLISLMASCAMLQSDNMVELGAGKGTFSFHIAQATQSQLAKDNTQFVLLDRKTFRSRSRVDYRIRAIGAKVLRITTDIVDYDLSTLNAEGSACTLFSKHFCGPATDIALDKIVSQVTGKRHVCIATCCHGIMRECEPYGGRNGEIARLLGGDCSARDWAMLCSTTGWATVSYNEDEGATICPATGKSRLEKRRLGQLAKCVIDSARVCELRKQGFSDAALVIYTDQSVENRVIVASSSK
jgi:hypothetical protein